MATLKLNTYRKLFLLNAISNFRDGVMGSMRLHKIIYEATKKLPQKPFTYIYYDHGQFCMDLYDIVDELILLGCVERAPLPSKRGFQYTITSSCKIDQINEIFCVIDKNASESINRAVKNIGYLPEKELLGRMHKELDDQGKKMNDDLFFTDFPDEIISSKLSEEDAETIELLFNPEFNLAIEKIYDTFDKIKIDVKRVNRIGHIS